MNLVKKSSRSYDKSIQNTKSAPLAPKGIKKYTFSAAFVGQKVYIYACKIFKSAVLRVQNDQQCAFARAKRSKVRIYELQKCNSVLGQPYEQSCTFATLLVGSPAIRCEYN